MISVIVPTLNEVETLESILRSVISQDNNLETIVVDGGSSDGTLEIANELADEVVIEKNGGVAHAKNVGIKKSDGDPVIFMEGDMEEVEDLFLVKVMRAFNDGADAVSWQSEPVECTLSEKLFNRFHDLNLFMLRKEQPNLVMAFRKELLEEVGGFGESRYGEDLDMHNKVVGFGGNVRDVNAVSYYHKVHRFSDMMDQARWLGNTRTDAKKSFLYFSMFVSLLMAPLGLFSPLFMLPYLPRYALAVFKSVKERDLLYPLIPIPDLVYSSSYVYGVLRRELIG